MQLQIETYHDGENIPHGYTEVCRAWQQVWNERYADHARLTFNTPINLKLEGNRLELPPLLKKIERVRNPDMYFAERSTGLELGGIEVTVHSPDGSNIDKRYPYLWISRQLGLDAFVATPYQKDRANGQTNRFPFRHASRNLAFLADWNPSTTTGTIQQLLPTRELQSGGGNIPREISSHLATWDQLGAFFAHRLAERTLGNPPARDSAAALEAIRAEWIQLAQVCIANTTHTEPSSLYRDGDRWVQVYNLRPDSGHWERGEGQFDSIDGRLMFTLDGIALLPPNVRPTRFEFWMPQFARGHLWATEQRDRGYGSKRFKNVCVTLPELSVVPFAVRFADELAEGDWAILYENQGLTLERLDAAPGVYRIADLVPSGERSATARRGLRAIRPEVIRNIERQLADPFLYVSTHRGYNAGWENDLVGATSALARSDVVLAPRLPSRMLAPLRRRIHCRLVGAEECEKAQLLMLRQIHRATSNSR